MQSKLLRKRLSLYEIESFDRRVTMPKPPVWSEALLEKFSPVFLALIDDSHLHAGRAKGTHWRVCIISDDFENSSRLQRHQAVFKSLQKKPWSLSLKTLTVSEGARLLPQEYASALCVSDAREYTWKQMACSSGTTISGATIWCYLPKQGPKQGPKNGLEFSCEDLLKWMQASIQCKNSS